MLGQISLWYLACYVSPFTHTQVYLIYDGSRELRWVRHVRFGL